MKVILNLTQFILLSALSIILFIVAFVAYFYFSQELAIRSLPGNYQELAQQCWDQKNFNCCLDSVREMAENGYQPVSGSQCPPGFKKAQLNCLGSFQWCEFVVE